MSETSPKGPRTKRPAGRRSQPAPTPKTAAPRAPGVAARAVAARLLSAVTDARTSLDGLTDRTGGHPEFRKLEARDQALVKAILMAALRRRGTIEAILSACLERPLPKQAASLRALLHVGAAQILFLDVPDSAAVDTAVELAGADPRSARFSGLTNAVLRRIAREKDAFLARFDDPMIDLPDWLAARLAAAYGEEATRRIAAIHRTPAPIDITIRSDGEGWAGRLRGTLVLPRTVRLENPEGAIGELPGFTDGEWWVQDAAAAIPARLFGEVSGLRIADLCAAPGGKTAQLASAGAQVTAFDISANRMKRLNENFTRLKLDVETRVGDIRALEPGDGFDGVLLDAPCSSTGTIRRHPDVAYTKDAAEIGKLAGVQAGLLESAAAFVKPGGLLVFSNCSLDPEEGEAVVGAFLEAHADFVREAVRAEELPGLEAALTPAGDVRTTPAMSLGEAAIAQGLDGFYAARLRRAG
ncbi:RsmB/NOP family class I SAM-dependent RNA methyltransferase [Aureimonas mangrovi]|uniref:RsmB/NOP family class I SAM-dependent RNA methyltransferase n=1 Tax=Aureimonas mangrovi TaxID=2758041 RepID=UPI001FEC49D3|nr:RsmB/NOP family class I SAM-dependent RNA methyltransferase [Aureimonas mangrovi]